MSELGYSFIPFAIAMYLFLYGPMMALNIILGYMCFKRAKSKTEKHIGLAIAALTPIVGFGVYLTVDKFEAKDQATLWWLLMTLIHLLPASVAGYLLYKNRPRTKSKKA